MAKSVTRAEAASTPAEVSEDAVASSRREAVSADAVASARGAAQAGEPALAEPNGSAVAAATFADGFVAPTGAPAVAPVASVLPTAAALPVVDPASAALPVVDPASAAEAAFRTLSADRGAVDAGLFAQFDARPGYLLVLCQQPGLRRAGVPHPARCEYPLDFFTGAQLDLLRAEPKLQLVAIGGEPEPQPGGRYGEMEPRFAPAVDPVLAGRAAADAISRPPNRSEPGVRNALAGAGTLVPGAGAGRVA